MSKENTEFTVDATEDAQALSEAFERDSRRYNRTFFEED